jgi:hypothetical protein
MAAELASKLRPGPDAEVRRLLESGLAEPTKIIPRSAGIFETLAIGLLKYETLTGEEIADRSGLFFMIAKIATSAGLSSKKVGDRLGSRAIGSYPLGPVHGY